MSPVVKRDHAAPRARQRRGPARAHPIHFFVGSKSMHKRNRVALAFIEKGDLDRAMLKSWHQAESRKRMRLGRSRASLRRQCAQLTFLQMTPGRTLHRTLA